MRVVFKLAPATRLVGPVRHGRQGLASLLAEPAERRREVAFQRLETSVGRLGRPDEVAAVAAMLASDEARFIVGANIVIDGGVTIRRYE